MPEHLSPEDQPERRLLDDQKIDIAVQWAQENERTLPDSAARRIAMQWHSGDASALYSFGSCGHINEKRLLRELHRTRREARSLEDVAQSSTEFHRLNLLTHYVVTHGDRRSVPNWQRTTEDHRDPVTFAADIEGPAEVNVVGAYIGRFATTLALAEHQIEASGLSRGIEYIAETYGEALARYITVDVEGYANDLHEDILTIEDPNTGGIHAYWREDQ